MPLSRRHFLQTAAAGAGLTLGFRAGAAPRGAVRGASFRPSAWLRVAPDGRVTVTVGKSEMGQGVRTSLPLLVAEELDVPLSRVDLAQAEPGPQFPKLGTGGSTSIEDLWEPLRKAAAAARGMLVAAAAKAWNVDPAACSVQEGAVVHPPTGRRLAYGKLVAEAARLPVPGDARPKDPAAFTRVGRPTRRVDGPRILDGTAVFGLDVKVPGMKYAALVHCPVFGGKALRWNADEVKARPGVRAVLPLGTGLAVVADSTHQALSAAEALQVTWEEGPHREFSSQAFRGRLEDLAGKPAPAVREEGDVAQALARASRRLEAVYEFPWQAHLAIEPPNCVAHVRGGACEIWAGSQSPNDAQRRVAKLLGIAPEAVKIHVTLIGGGFGRRLSSDFILEAAELSKALQGPVQVVWSRKEDIQHDRYHPMSLHHMEAGLEGGAPTAWLHRVAAPSILLAWAEGRRSPYLVKSETNGAADIPYGIPALRVEYAEAPCHVPLGWWRGIQAMPNILARECFLDEIAAALGKDPLALRLELLGQGGIRELGGEKVDAGRLRRVLELAGEKSGWGRPLPPGHGRGLASLAYEGRTYVALVAEVSVKEGRLKVLRMVAAVDCGLVVNPLGAEAQVEGGILFGLSALSTAITLEDGRVRQSSYGELPVARMADTPDIQVHLVPGGTRPTGLGEPPAPPTLPAVLNAIHGATGRRLRRLPLRPEDLT